ncbi:hypothetical protein C9374_000633 [Naegleria lovaniensis]|uniref:Uncharacterized protein n=1 Tax=Naegleria lovaniensis TaxID=51637 RepID=A0AA88GYR5_NAELO|nr:uncharacterized protein C9374_000633 [Naegleria lovaniensis]KAG2388469.1 hypothetical protein C9374_000633 [Naegleria lovaniensis]
MRTDKLSLADICKLQYDLHENNDSEPVESKKQKEFSLPSSLKLSSLQNVWIVVRDDREYILFDEEKFISERGNAILSSVVNEHDRSSPFENSIDPIEYLKSGELVLFPRPKRSSSDDGQSFKIIISLQELLEYYRHFPNFHWSKYPQLLELIRNNLLRHEKRSLERLEGEYLEYQKQQLDFMREYHRFVSRFSLTEWLSNLFKIHVLGVKKKETSELREEEPITSKDLTKSRIMTSFRHLLPYVTLMALFWIFKLLTKLLSLKRR